MDVAAQLIAPVTYLTDTRLAQSIAPPHSLS